MRRNTDTPFVAAPSEVNGRMHSGDENALIALYKMRPHMGSPSEQGLAARPSVDRALL
jgi:hypothetical protein